MIFEKALGPEHPDVATSFANLAVLYKAQSRAADALTAIRCSSAILAHRFGEGARSEGEGSLSEQRRFAYYFEINVALLAEASTREPKAAETLAAEAFDLAQYARASDTAAQVARMAARHAAGSDALAQRVRARQDLAARLAVQEANLLKEIDRPAGPADAGRPTPAGRRNCAQRKRRRAANSKRSTPHSTATSRATAN